MILELLDQIGVASIVQPSALTVMYPSPKLLGLWRDISLAVLMPLVDETLLGGWTESHFLMEILPVNTFCGLMLLELLITIKKDRADCPCSTVPGDAAQSKFGSFHYCDTGNSGNSSQNRWFTEKVLWSGEGCPSTSTCCNNPNLPYFCRTDLD